MPAFTATLGTASSVFSGAAIVTFLVTQHAQAEFLGPESLRDLGFSADRSSLINTTEEKWKDLDREQRDVWHVGVKGHASDPVSVWGGAGSDVKITKIGANQQTILSDTNPDHNLNATNVWLTSDIFSGPDNNYFTVNRAGYISNSVQNLYVNSAGLNFTVNHTGDNAIAANLIIGSATPGNKAPVDGCTLMFSAGFKTTGYLEVVEDAKIGFNGSNFNVFIDSLQGAGNLSLVANGNGAVSAALNIASNSLSYTGQLIFKTASGKTASAVKIANGATLHIGGLGADNGGSILSSGTTSTLIIEYNGETELTATKVNFGAGVSLEKKGSGTQVLSDVTFAGNNSITLSEGTLKLVSEDAISLASLSGESKDAKLIMAGGGSLSLEEVGEYAGSISLEDASQLIVAADQTLGGLDLGATGEIHLNGGEKLTIDGPLTTTSDTITIYTDDERPSEGSLDQLGGTLVLKDITGLDDKKWVLKDLTHLTVDVDPLPDDRTKPTLTLKSFYAEGDVKLTIGKECEVTIYDHEHVGGGVVENYFVLDGSLTISGGTLRITRAEDIDLDEHPDAHSHRDTDLILTDGATLHLQAGTYHPHEGSEELNGVNILSLGFHPNGGFWGAQFKSLTIEGTEATLKLGATSAGYDKSSVTFNEKVTLTKVSLTDDQVLNLNVLSEPGKDGVSPFVYFKGGADFSEGVLHIDGYTVNIAAGHSDDGPSIIIHKLTSDVPNENCSVRFRSEDDTAVILFKTEESYTVNRGLYIDKAVEGGTNYGRVRKEGTGTITFHGTSWVTYIDIAEGSLRFTGNMLEGGGRSKDPILDYTVAKDAAIELGVKNVNLTHGFAIEGDMLLCEGVKFGIHDAVDWWAGWEGELPDDSTVKWSPVYIGGLTTESKKSDDVKDYAWFVFCTDIDGVRFYNPMEQMDFQINVQDKGAVKEAYGVNLMGVDVTKLGEGTQVLSNFTAIGSLTLGAEDEVDFQNLRKENNVLHYGTAGGVLELRGKGDILDEVQGYDTASELRIAQLHDETNGNSTLITFAKGIRRLEGKLGLTGGVTIALGNVIDTSDDGKKVIGESVIGGLTGENEVGTGSPSTRNFIRKMTMVHYNNIYSETFPDDYMELPIDLRPVGWEAPETLTLRIDFAKEAAPDGVVKHGGMVEVEPGISLVKSGTGMQEVTGILADSLLVEGGRFRITGTGSEDESVRTGWENNRTIKDVTVDGAGSYFEVSVEGANYWWATGTTLTLQNGGIFRSSGANGEGKKSTFYVQTLYVSGEGEQGAGKADAYIKWSHEDAWGGVDTEGRKADAHEYTFGLLSSVDENRVVDSSREYVLEISEMTRADKDATQGVIFRQIKDFNGTIRANVGDPGNGNFFQIGMDVADIGLTFDAENMRSALDASLIDTVNTGAYHEAGDVFNTKLEVEGSGVFSEVFRKRGEGKLTIGGAGKLTIGQDGSVGGGVLFMNYLGELDIPEIKVGNNVTLLYTTGENNTAKAEDLKYGGVIELSYEQMVKLNSFYIDLLHLENVEDLYLQEDGISLGIFGVTGEEDLEELKEKITLRGISKQTDWELKWGSAPGEENTVYLHVNGELVYEKESDFMWDSRWGGVAYFAPTQSEMDEQQFYTGAEKADGVVFTPGDDAAFEGNALALAASKYKTSSYTENSQDRTAIRLIGGGAGWDESTTATVIGGKLYKVDDKTHDVNDTGFWEVRGNSYISLVDPSKESSITDGDADKLHFHLLVGGSVCLPNVEDNSSMSATVKAVGSFKGNSHIQMNGGQVDYIVGGNHVNNSAFVFRGRSFISVMDGEVYGGIVGGSTLTKGSVNKYTQAFDGSTHIFIYTPLHNSSSTPAISDGTNSAAGLADEVSNRTGVSFTAVVGGNAWIDLPQTVVDGEVDLKPTFRGNSNIVIDLSKSDVGTFEKDIVGGNFTAFAANAGSEKRNTEYISNGLTSYVMVTAKGDDVFTGSINGASRRSSGGSGMTEYTGDVLVQLRGGQYQAAVAGGMWMDASADGDHKAHLWGDTTVDAGNNGSELAIFWRLVGGSYSLAGGVDACETSKGDSTVNLWSGTVSNENMAFGLSASDVAQQQQVALVVGGDLYRNNAGSEQERDGNSTVNIHGGVLKHVHVVGGDYANSSDDDTSAAETDVSITGMSSVNIDTTVEGSETVKLTGLVVGGSYLTDAGTSGSVSVGSTYVLLKGVKGDDTPQVFITAEDAENHEHTGSHIAVVGGNVLVDQMTGGAHKLTVENRTTIDIYDGVKIDGKVVGGSYVNNSVSDANNTIGHDEQKVRINIRGGEIDDDVYGGHYSENVDDPDTLMLGDIDIFMTGGSVTGNVVGGGYRATASDTTSDDDKAPPLSTQGAVRVVLSSGSLNGNVYAAGFNGTDSEDASAQVDTVTASTHVFIKRDFKFADAEDLLISGGYGRKNNNVTRGSITDDATLTFYGSNESINTRSAGTVTLANVNVVEVWGEGAEIAVNSNLYVLRKAETHAANSITKNGEGSLRVQGLSMWKSDDMAESSSYRGQIIVNDGYLKLTGSAQGQDLSGGLTVNLATAKLRHYGLKENAYLQGHEMDGAMYVGNADGSVPATRAKISFSFDAEDLQMTADPENELTQTRVSEFDGYLYYGKYYLITGLDESITAADEYFDYEDALKELEGKIDAWCKQHERENYYVVDLKIIDNSLVLRVRDDREKFGWWWGCTGGDKDAEMGSYDADRASVDSPFTVKHDPDEDDFVTWSDTSAANWTQHGTQLNRYDDTVGNPYTDGEHAAWELSPRGQNLHFGASGNGNEVQLVNNPETGDLAPRSVWVQDAQYTFTTSSKSAGDAVLRIGSDAAANVNEEDLMFDRDKNPNKKEMLLGAGALRVGGNYWGKDQSVADNDAELILQVETHADDYYLADRGALALDYAEAVDGTIHFDGGLLAYMEGGKEHADLSGRVSEDSTGSVRIRVGDTKLGAYHQNDKPTKSGLRITWGDTSAAALPSGVKLALTSGMEKSGVDALTLQWASSEAPAKAYTGFITVQEGELVYRHETRGTEHEVKLSGPVSVAADTKLTFLEAGDASGTLSVAGDITGEGHVVIGSDGTKGNDRLSDATARPYSLSGNNAAFAGVLELRGASEAAEADLVELGSETAPGGENTTLRLAGRHFRYGADAGDDPKTVAVKTVAVKVVQIVDGSVNYVGGLSVDDQNREITLQGKLALTDDAGGDSADNSGILANAWGEEGAGGFHHTYNGASMDGYQGCILAGAAATKSPLNAETSSASSWTFRNTTGADKAPEEFTATLGGAGSFIFGYSTGFRLVGPVGVDAGSGNDLTSLKNLNLAAGGEITIADGDSAEWWSEKDVVTDGVTNQALVLGKNIATGSISGAFHLGDETTYGTWSGSTLSGAADTALVLVNGVLRNALEKSADNQAELIVRTKELASGSTKVDVGGTLGSMFDAITITAGGQMLGAAGTISVNGNATQVKLYLTDDNVGNAAGTPGQYLIVGKEPGGVSMEVTDLSHFSLNVGNDVFRTMLAQAMDETLSGSADTFLHIVGNGSLSIDASQHEGLLKQIQGMNTDLLDMLGWSVKEKDNGGDIVLTYVETGFPDFDPPEIPGPPPGPGEFPLVPVPVRPREIYLVIEDHGDTWNTYSDAHEVTEYGRLSSHFKATFIDAGKTLSLTLSGSPEEQQAVDLNFPFPIKGDHQRGIDNDIAAGGALVNNLVGMEDSHFHISNGDAARSPRVCVVLQNLRYENPEDIWLADPFYDSTSAYGLDTFYEGCIDAEEGVDLRKTGWGRLTIGSAGSGHIVLADGTLTMSMGGITLQGDGNSLAELRFAYDSAEDAAKGEERTFWLLNGRTTIGKISEAGSAAAERAGADIAMEGALLVLTGESELADSAITGRASTVRNTARLSEVQVAEGALLSLTAADKRQLSNVGLILDAGGKLNIGSSTLNDVRGISGAGDLAGAAAKLLVTDNLVDANGYAFSGTLSGAGNELAVASGAALLLRNAIGGNGWNVVNRGTLTIDVSGSPASADKLTHMGDLTLGSGSTTTLVVNTDLKSRTLPTLTVDHLIAEGGATFVLETTGSGRLLTDDSNLRGPRYGVAFVRAEEDQERYALTIQEEGRNLFFAGKGKAMWDQMIVDAYIEDGVLWLQMEKRATDTPLEGVAPDKNAQSGANHVSGVINPDKNPHYDDIVDGSDLAGVIDSVLSDSDKGNSGSLNTTLAGLAGSSTAVYGMVMAEDIHRQLRTTRNRAVMASSERCWSGVSCPALFHAYILGESGYHKMDADNYAPGFTLSNWGGTLGMDVDLKRTDKNNTNLGLSITAMYGDLRVNGPDTLRADMDTQYLTAYARLDRGKWMHTLALSGGLTDLHNIKRTVRYGTDSFTTRGSTDGYSLGGIYELGYNAYTNEAGTRCFQLIANVEARHVALDAYTETGSNAALNVGNVSQDFVTFGLGGRYRAVVGYNAWNRASTFEARALAKADIADRSGTVANSLVYGAPERQGVESAKQGAVGVELGAGLTVPCGRCGSVFIDSSLELRKGYIQADANIGYRMTF